MKVYYSNVDNSIMSQYEELCILISHKNYDVISLSEIKPKNGRIPTEIDMYIPGYELITSNLSTADTRGVCMYIKENLNPRQVQPPTTIKYEDSVWASVTGNEGGNLLLGCIYRSGTPSKDIPKNEMLYQLLQWAANKNTYTRKIIQGDFNHPLITWNPDPVIHENLDLNHPDNKFIQCISDTFLRQHTCKPTRVRGDQKPTQDDLIFANEKNFATTRTPGPYRRK